jgi:hypothetical protein
MSIALMTVVWRLENLSSTQKLVMLALCDNANDQGECYPSMSQLARKTGLSDRSVRETIRWLETQGLMKTQLRHGTSPLYHMTPERRSTPEPSSPRNLVPPTPEPSSAPPRNVVPPTPERGSAKPSFNHQSNHQLTVTRRADDLPEWLDPEAWGMWDRYRQSLGKGWTPDAKRLAMDRLGKLREQGYDPRLVIENAIGCSWRGIYQPRGEKPSPAGTRKAAI